MCISEMFRQYGARGVSQSGEIRRALLTRCPPPAQLAARQPGVRVVFTKHRGKSLVATKVRNGISWALSGTGRDLCSRLWSMMLCNPFSPSGPLHPHQAFAAGDLILAEPPLAAAQDPSNARVVLACQHCFRILGPTLEAHVGRALRGGTSGWCLAWFGPLSGCGVCCARARIVFQYAPSIALANQRCTKSRSSCRRTARMRARTRAMRRALAAPKARCPTPSLPRKSPRRS